MKFDFKLLLIWNFGLSTLGLFQILNRILFHKINWILSILKLDRDIAKRNEKLETLHLFSLIISSFSIKVFETKRQSAALL